MKRQNIISTLVISISGWLTLSGDAYAIVVPDTGTCNSSATCLQLTQNGNGGGMYVASSSGFGIEGNSSSSYGVAGFTNASGPAVYGQTLASGGIGVKGYSVGYVGVYGVSDTNNGVIGQVTSSSTAAAITALSPSSSGLAFWGQGNIIITGSAAIKAGGGPWTAPSDSRIKKDVKDFNQGLNELLRVKPVRYKYNGLGGTSDDGREYVGVIAQDIEKVMPTMVGSRLAKLHPTDAKETAIKEVDPNAFTYMLINAVQEQQKVIQRQDARIAALEQGKAPLASSMMSLGGIETGLAIGLLPVGLVVAARKRRKHKR